MAAPDDDDPERILTNHENQIDLGWIDTKAASATGRPEGPIRLQWGYPHEKSFGLRHITSNASRVKAINGWGFESCQNYIWAVAEHWTRIHASEKGRLILVWPQQGADLALVVNWTGEFWSVVTALPFRMVKQEKLFER